MLNVLPLSLTKFRGVTCGDGSPVLRGGSPEKSMDLLTRDGVGYIQGHGHQAPRHWSCDYCHA